MAHAPAPVADAVPKKKPRRDDIQRAKGLAIFLVVLGHLVTGAPPYDADWYMGLRALIYMFHMPFFMALSGYTMYISSSQAKAQANPVSFIAQRAKRLLIPFLIFGVLIVLGKHVVGSFLYVDNYSQNLTRDLINLLWFTQLSAAQSIWYVFVLFQICVIVAILGPIARFPFFIFLAVLPLMMFAYGLPYFYLDRLLIFMPFFFLGGALAQRGEQFLRLVDRYLWLSLIIFGIALATSLLIEWRLALISCGITSIPVILGICRLPAFARDRVLLYLGALSFSIYLLNTIFIGLVKAVLLPFVSWGGSGFFIYFALMLAAGLIGPILVKRLIFARWRVADEITN